MHNTVYIWIQHLETRCGEESFLSTFFSNKIILGEDFNPLI